MIFYKKETEKIELVASPVGKQATFAMTTYEADPKREVFGDAGDQTEEFSDENKSIVWFLVKQVKHTTKKIFSIAQIYKDSPDLRVLTHVEDLKLLNE